MNEITKYIEQLLASTTLTGGWLSFVTLFALFAVTVDPPTKEAELLINPLGLKIKDLTMSIESTSKAPTPALQGGTSNET